MSGRIRLASCSLFCQTAACLPLRNAQQQQLLLQSAPSHSLGHLGVQLDQPIQVHLRQSSSKRRFRHLAAMR